MKSLIKKAFILNISAIVVTLISITGCQRSKPDPSKEFQPIVDKYVEVWNSGNLNELDAIMDSNYVRTANTLPNVEGLDGQKKLITTFRTAYPDLKLTFDKKIYADNSAAFRWVFKGTNTGPGQMPPTEKPVVVWGLTILDFANGKITRELVSYDNLKFMEQLGYTITPPAAEKK